MQIWEALLENNKKAKVFNLIAAGAALVFVGCAWSYENIAPGTLKAIVVLIGFTSFVVAIACAGIAHDAYNDWVGPHRE